MFRTTIEVNNGIKTQYFDFKEDKLVAGEDFGERKETLSIPYQNENQAESIVEFFDMMKENELVRKRIVYEKGSVKLELDEYIVPKQACIVAIEGEKSEIDKVYSELKQYKI